MQLRTRIFLKRQQKKTHRKSIEWSYKTQTLKWPRQYVQKIKLQVENFVRELETRDKKLYYTIHKLDYITIKSFYIVKRLKRNPHAGRKYCSTHVNGKGLYPEYIFKKRRNKKKGERGQGCRRKRERKKDDFYKSIKKDNPMENGP